MKKNILSDIAFTVLMLLAATAVSFCFFHFGNKNAANITVMYTLALILTALKTRGYVYGILSALFCVIAVNFFFSYPYFKFNFTLDGYPVTFLGMLAIAIITSTTTTALKRQRMAISEREKALAEADKEKLRANLLRAVSHDLRTPLTASSVLLPPIWKIMRNLPMRSGQSLFPTLKMTHSGCSIWWKICLQ